LNRRDLLELAPDYAGIEGLCREHRIVGFYVFALQFGHVVAAARMFAPIIGINEGSGTGMAAGPLACALATKFYVNGNTFCIEQGVCLSNPARSYLYAELEKRGETVSGVWIGGRAAVVGKEAVEL
jgi:PhzF family phenazine biosynthesis protein